MIRSYSLDLRERVVDAVDAGVSRRSAARHFAVSDNSAVRWVGRSAREGSCAAWRVGCPTGKGPLNDQLDFLMASDRERADVAVPRRQWITGRQPFMRYQPRLLVFLDETSRDHQIARLRCRSLYGLRLKTSVPAGR
jgi:Transposase